jgi:transposase InsO family protein
VSTYRFIDVEKAYSPVRLLCRVLEVSRSAYYAWADAEPSSKAVDDATLLVHIKGVHRRSRGTYGRPRVVAELKAEGHDVGKRRVGRLMAEAGIQGTPKRKFKGSTTDSDHDERIADNLLNRNFTVDSSNAAWVGDITYLETAAGWVYLAVLIDLFSRKVVGWSLATHMRKELCLDALNQALTTREPPPGLIAHTDRGSQYASGDYQRALESAGAVPSMSRKGNCWDNAVSESFFGTLEQELVRQLEKPWADDEEARREVSAYIHGFFNQTRRHSTIGYQSPVDFEATHRQQEAAASKEAA